MEIKSDVTTKETCCEFLEMNSNAAIERWSSMRKRLNNSKIKRWILLRSLQKNLAIHAGAGFSTEADKEI